MSFKQIVGPALLFVISATLLVQLPVAIADRAGVYEWFDPIVDIRTILADRYVEEPDSERMQKAMIDAMIDTLDDPYTQYVPAVDTAAFNKQLRGTYAGIGAEVNLADGFLVIVSPMDDSPSLAAGVLAGDVVLEIEGESTFEMPVDACVERLTGEIGTPVTILVRHLDGSEEQITIVRDRIITRTVRGLRRIGESWSFCVDETHGLAYVKVTQFNAATVDELSSTLCALVTQGLGGLVLDLRDNPGGGLPVAIGVADLFLDSGRVVSVRPREGTGEEVTYEARSAGTLPDFPMVVLVNGNSASASEIVSGALQENGRAKVLGTRSFGKGSVQEVRPLEYSGGTLKYTTAHYFLPSGRNLNRNQGAEAWGVDPDPGLVVPIGDRQYMDSFLARREYEIIREPDEKTPACVSAPWIREQMLDEQLAVAVEALEERIGEAAWPRVTEEEPARVALSQELTRAADARTRLLEQLGQLDDRIAEMENRAEAAGRVGLLPPEVDLVEGTLTVRDRDGAVIGEYVIEAGNVECALNALTLTPLGGDDEHDE